MSAWNMRSPLMVGTLGVLAALVTVLLFNIFVPEGS